MKRITKEHIDFIIGLVVKKRFFLTETFRYFSHPNKIIINGFAKSTNFGDALNIPLVEYLSEKKALPYKYLLLSNKRLKQLDHYTVIGSILQSAKEGSLVWGSGFISNTNSVIKRPKKVYAVRGPLTREIYLKNKIDCPAVFGDPALLLPFIYNPQSIERCKIGIIPHYIDKKSSWLFKQKNKHNVVVIDIETGYNWEQFLNQVLKCKVVITSSLHAIIIANAYNIPSIWVSFSDKITGGNFKFRDYYLSVGKQITTPFNIAESTQLEELFDNLDYESNHINLNLLVDACPFATDQKKELLKSRIQESVKNSVPNTPNISIN
ncbi:polysaccharide pyruvyl transferase family protein [Pontibacter sp. JH31]|uniref:Polysaccharide pyruvyl transferase family protein n=1 Tax=Pontibacter aquaedesilientis TaxID=2766980 RepID=A0ABR7XFB4_9BACT|nr:polysaccharide pyruvyl transferase family protein [Pontibacter aquaedesilientis]MBD1396954.1 polysaccharide pyruvyl transferase family protein [Pontibacter aquaedesilientis]